MFIKVCCKIKYKRNVDDSRRWIRLKFKHTIKIYNNIIKVKLGVESNFIKKYILLISNHTNYPLSDK